MTAQTNKKSGSIKRKLIPATAMLLASAMALASSTYAWFTMNKEVTVTGMELKTKVSGNLLICDTNVEADFSTEELTQTRKALLEPVSSVSGADSTFFYTVNAKANGDAVEDVYTAYNASTVATGDNASDYANKFSQDYGLTKTAVGTVVDGETAAVGYVDYVFYLKATADSTDHEVKMTKCNLLYNSAAIADGTEAGRDIDRAWRIAVFSSDITANGGDGTTGSAASVATSNAIVDNKKNILTLEDAENQSGTIAITAATGTPATSASYNTWATNNIGRIQTGSPAADDDDGTAYYKVTVRVWLEGEDNTCTSETYAKLTNAWTLDLEFTLGDSATAVSNIGSAVAGA